MTAQQTFLGQILQDNEVYYKASPVAWWFEGQDRAVFNAIESCLDSGIRADISTVGLKLLPEYVASLTSGVYTTENWRFFADKCRKWGMQDELRKLAMTITDEVQQKDPEAVIDTVSAAIDRIASGSDEYKIMAMADKLLDVVNELEKRYHNRGQLAGIQSGFGSIDEAFSGLQPERLYIIGARPSQGKSALALNMASFISSYTSIGFLSLESPWKEMVMREFSTTTGIDSSKLASGYFKGVEFDMLVQGAEQLAKKQFYIYDRPNCTLADVIGQARRMVRKNKAQVIFIDYLQLIQIKAETDRERVAMVSKALKNLARELKVPIVALAQLRRDADGRRPGLGDFQHTSQIEQDADGAMLIWWRVYDSASGKWLQKAKPDPMVPSEEQKYFILIEKNRDGKTGDIEVDFNKSIVKFIEKNKT